MNEIEPCVIVTLPDGSEDRFPDPDGRINPDWRGDSREIATPASTLRISNTTTGEVHREYAPGAWVRVRKVPEPTPES